MMKPRNKFQREVIESSKSLISMDSIVESWAIKECTEHLGYATKNRVACMDCGGKFSPDKVIRKSAICPHCNTRIKVEYSRCTTFKQKDFFALAEVYGEFQVIRNFIIYGYHKSGQEPQYTIMEIVQNWILPNGKREVVARKHNLTFYADSWSDDLEIRAGYGGYYVNGGSDKYVIYPSKYHPDSKFKPEYSKYGIDKNLQGLTFLQAVDLLPVDTRAETLLKAKQYALLEHCGKGRILRYWSSIKICIRNKYKITDGSMYLDYLDLLSYFNKDLRNAHYVCPAKLKEAHDLLVAKKRKIKEEMDRIEAEREAAEQKLKKKNEKSDFLKLKSDFFGISFSKGNVTIRVLDSLEDYKIEGDLLNHCVFVNDYHLKPDSLILSACVDNVRTETIEVNLRDLTIAQCRGKNNENTEFHYEIMRLVNVNMHKIAERLETRKSKLTTKSHAAA